MLKIPPSVLAQYDDRVPSSLLESLAAYSETGRPTGGFLAAVLSNDLMDAVGRADDKSLAALRAICTFIYMELPRDCHGSREAWREWVAAGARRIEEKNA